MSRQDETRVDSGTRILASGIRTDTCKEMKIPMTNEERLAKERCTRLLLDMYLKYGPKLWPKEENKNTKDI